MNMIVPKTAAEEALGLALPHRRMEEWKWTDLRRMLTAPYVRKSVSSRPADIERLLQASPFAGVKAQRILLVNGELDAAHSSQRGSPAALPTVGAEDDAILAINRQLEAQGVNLHFDGNADDPVELVHVVTGGETRGVAVRHRIEVAPARQPP